MNAICEVVANDCSATFYVWAQFKGVKIDSDVAFVNYLRDQSQVAIASTVSNPHYLIDGNESFESAIERDVERAKVLILSDSEWKDVQPQIVASITGSSSGVGLATVPGSAFLMNPSDKFLRFSCARSSLAELRVAMDVLENAIAKLNN